MKKALCLILAMGFAIFATGCGEDLSFEDTNGYTNFELTQITDENIINKDIGSTDFEKISSDGDSEDMTTLTEFKSEDFNGVAEIYSAHMDGSSDLIIDVKLLEVYEGNFQLYVVHNGEIVYDFVINEMYETCEFGSIEGDVSVVMAGESANFQLAIEIW